MRSSGINNRAPDLICMANIVFPDLCTFDDALPYMVAMADAIEKNRVRVRVIMRTQTVTGWRIGWGEQSFYKNSKGGNRA